jgi:serine/threonine protein kinase
VPGALTDVLRLAGLHPMRPLMVLCARTAADGVGHVLLCDFGFARLLPDAADASITDYVSTRWYR